MHVWIFRLPYETGVPMSRTVCGTHGAQTGPHCCGHVLAATEQPDVAKTLGKLALFKIDVVGNGKDFLHFVLCQSCGHQYGLSDASTLSSEFFAEDKLPWTAPVCDLCFRSLQARLSSS